MTDALDAVGAADPNRPSRSELIRRIVTEWLASKSINSDGDLRRGLRDHLADVVLLVGEAKPSPKRERVLLDLQRQIDELEI